MTLSPDFSIRDDFPPVDYDQWRKLVDADLKGASFEKQLVTHTCEGIDLQSLYCRKDFPSGSDPYGFPGLPPYIRGSQPLGALQSGLDLRQEHLHPDLETTNRAILEDVAGGVTSVLLRLDAAADGVMIHSVNDLDAALAEVRLDRVGVALDAGADFLPAAALLVALWQRRRTAPEQPAGAFNADPLAVLANTGELPKSALSLMADLAQWTSQNFGQVTSVVVDTSSYHHAGATAAQDLAFGLATGVEYLRAMTNAGLSIDAAARQMLFRISLGTHHFLAIGKLRAARRLWWQVIESCGASESEGRMRIHARTTGRVLTRRDPYTNIVRNSACVFAACIGGAEIITSLPFDHLVGLPDELSRRLARNTLLILQEEGHLHRVADPAGGSWFFDSMTEQLAAAAWIIFQEIERRGGMLAALESGWVHEQVDVAHAQRASALAAGRQVIVGVSHFVDPSLQSPVSESSSTTPSRAAIDRGNRQVRLVNSFPELIDAATRGATIDQLRGPLGSDDKPTHIQPFLARTDEDSFVRLAGRGESGP
jgi:methylmalonyl-CoA mutase